VIPTIAPFILPIVLPKLRRQYPELESFLIEDQTERIHDGRLDRELSALLLALPGEMCGVEALELFRDRFCLTVREGTERVGPNKYRFNLLDAESILLLKDGHCLRDQVLSVCKIHDTRKVRRFGASSLLTLIEMVDADFGVTFVPEMARGSTLLLRNSRVRLHDLGDDSYRTVGMVWRTGSRGADEFRMLGDFIRDNC
jgi:LysR family transcriptional regulator, hydrogen peroxide-inducible genes activator